MSLESLYISDNKLGNYEIVLETNCLNHIFSKLKFGNKYLIISDSNVENLYGKVLLDQLISNGFDCKLISFPAGEKHKNLDTLIQIYRDIGLSLDRESCIINLGGGITCDMGGFIAATYMRGINFIHIPTSLLAMVDASIGGKLGVNLLQGKNYVGLFHNPSAVFIDPILLETLAPHYWADGFAEIIKHAIIQPDPLFLLLNHYFTSDAINADLLTTIIYESIQIKLAIVQKDALETGLRKLLNFGHTIGHALEEYYHYEHLSHGQAVAFGILVNLAISHQRGYITLTLIEKVTELFRSANLSLKLTEITSDINRNLLIEYIQYDKKTVGNTNMFVLIKDLGHPVICTGLTQQEIMEGLEYII